MNISEALIEQFFRGTCSAEEKAAVMAYFKNNPDAWAQHVTPESWQQFQAAEALPPAVSDKMLQVIEAHIARKAGVRTMMRKVMVAAAVLTPIIISVFLFTRQKGPAAHSLAMQPAAADSMVVLQRNTTKHNRSFTLADGSKVTLNPDSEIQYRKAFGSKDRVVYVTGEALFTVTRNRKQPFIVHGGGLTTTVLGTVFKVTAWKGSTKTTRVHLLSGKVMVAPDSPLQDNNRTVTYLQPGQELQYNAVKKLITVNRLNEQPLKVRDTGTMDMPARKSLDALAFNDEPLTNVFSSMEVKCGIRFVYKKSILAERNYTGSFTVGKDWLDRFLQDIAALNNLIINKKKNLVYITQ